MFCFLLRILGTVLRWRWIKKETQWNPYEWGCLCLIQKLTAARIFSSVYLITLLTLILYVQIFRIWGFSNLLRTKYDVRTRICMGETHCVLMTLTSLVLLSVSDIFSLVFIGFGRGIRWKVTCLEHPKSGARKLQKCSFLGACTIMVNWGSEKLKIHKYLLRSRFQK